MASDGQLKFSFRMTSPSSPSAAMALRAWARRWFSASARFSSSSSSQMRSNWSPIAVRPSSAGFSGPFGLFGCGQAQGVQGRSCLASQNL